MPRRFRRASEYQNGAAGTAAIPGLKFRDAATDMPYVNVISSSRSGLQSATDRIDRLATRVASSSAFSAYDTSAPSDVVDISAELVDLTSARIDAAANIKVLKVANEVQQRAIDLFA